MRGGPDAERASGTGDILVFADVRQTWADDAHRPMLREFRRSGRRSSQRRSRARKRAGRAGGGRALPAFEKQLRAGGGLMPTWRSASPPCHRSRATRVVRADPGRHRARRRLLATFESRCAGIGSSMTSRLRAFDRLLEKSSRRSSAGRCGRWPAICSAAAADPGVASCRGAIASGWRGLGTSWPGSCRAVALLGSADDRRCLIRSAAGRGFAVVQAGMLSMWPSPAPHPGLQAASTSPRGGVVSGAQLPAWCVLVVWATGRTRPGVSAQRSTIGEPFCARRTRCRRTGSWLILGLAAAAGVRSPGWELAARGDRACAAR